MEGFLDDEEWNVKVAGALILDKLGWTTDDLRLRTLYYLAKGELEGIESLKYKALPILLEDGLRYPEARDIVVKAFAKLPRAFRKLVKLLEEDKLDDEGLCTGILASGEMRKLSAVRPLMQFAREKVKERGWNETLDTGFDSELIEALTKLGKRPVPKLLKYLDYSPWQRRKLIVQVLRKIGDRNIVPRLLRILREDKAFSVRLAAIEALVDIGY